MEIKKENSYVILILNSNDLIFSLPKSDIKRGINSVIISQIRDEIGFPPVVKAIHKDNDNLVLEFSDEIFSNEFLKNYAQNKKLVKFLKNPGFESLEVVFANFNLLFFRRMSNSLDLIFYQAKLQQIFAEYLASSRHFEKDITSLKSALQNQGIRSISHNGEILYYFPEVAKNYHRLDYNPNLGWFDRLETEIEWFGMISEADKLFQRIPGISSFEELEQKYSAFDDRINSIKRGIEYLYHQERRIKTIIKSVDLYSIKGGLDYISCRFENFLAQVLSIINNLWCLYELIKKGKLPGKHELNFTETYMKYLTIEDRSFSKDWKTGDLLGEGFSYYLLYLMRTKVIHPEVDSISWKYHFLENIFPYVTIELDYRKIKSNLVEKESKRIRDELIQEEFPGTGQLRQRLAEYENILNSTDDIPKPIIQNVERLRNQLKNSMIPINEEFDYVPIQSGTSRESLKWHVKVLKKANNHVEILSYGASGSIEQFYDHCLQFLWRIGTSILNQLC